MTTKTHVGSIVIHVITPTSHECKEKTIFHAKARDHTAHASSPISPPLRFLAVNRSIGHNAPVKQRRKSTLYVIMLSVQRSAHRAFHAHLFHYTTVVLHSQRRQHVFINKCRSRRRNRRLNILNTSHHISII